MVGRLAWINVCFRPNRTRRKQVPYSRTKIRCFTSGRADANVLYLTEQGVSWKSWRISALATTSGEHSRAALRKKPFSILLQVFLCIEMAWAVLQMRVKPSTKVKSHYIKVCLQFRNSSGTSVLLLINWTKSHASSSSDE